MNIIITDIPLQRNNNTTVINNGGSTSSTTSGGSVAAQLNYLPLIAQSNANLVTDGIIQLPTSLNALFGKVTGATATYIIDANGWIFRNSTKNVASISKDGELTVKQATIDNGTNKVDLTVNVDGNLLISGSDMTDKPVIQSIIDGVFQDLLINPNGGNVSINTEYSEGYRLNVNGTIKSHNITINGGTHNNVLSTDAIDGKLTLNGQPLGAKIYKIDELLSGTFSSEDISNSVNAYVGKNLLQRVTAIETTGSQPAFNGIGFVKVAGSVISYDNNSYSLSNHTHNQINGVLIGDTIWDGSWRKIIANGYNLAIQSGDGSHALQIGYNGSFQYDNQTIWHNGNFNPANYLPLAGGTLTGALVLKSNTPTLTFDSTAMGRSAYIGMSDGANMYVSAASNGNLYLGSSTTTFINGYAKINNQTYVGNYLNFNSSLTAGDYMGSIGFNRDVNNGAILNPSYGAIQVQNLWGKLQFQIYTTGGGLKALHNMFPSGNVGIGQDSDNGHKLDVTGDIYISTSDQSNARLIINNASGHRFDLIAGVHNYSQAGFSIWDNTIGATRLHIANDGSTSIGYNQAQGYMLAVNGTGYFNNDLTVNLDVHCRNLISNGSNSNFISSDVNIGFNTYQGYKLSVNGGGFFSTGLDVGGNVAFGSSAATYILMRDDDSPSGHKYIHANGNQIGFLDSGGSWSVRWDNSGNQVNVGSVNAPLFNGSGAGLTGNALGLSVHHLDAGLKNDGDWNTFDWGITSGIITRVESGSANPPAPYIYNWSLYQQGNNTRGSQLALGAYGGDIMTFRCSTTANVWGDWRTVWHNGNLTPAVGATADTIVKRSPEGYIFARYINASNGTETDNAANYIFDIGDGYFRKKPLSYVRSEIVNSSSVINALGYYPVGGDARGKSTYFTGGNANTSDASNASGFYCGSSVTGMPSGDWWNWMTCAGGSWGGSDGYAYQLANSFWGDDLRYRRMTSGTWHDWQSIIHSGNIMNQNVANSDTVDGVHMWRGSLSAYNALTKDSNTMYIII